MKISILCDPNFKAVEENNVLLLESLDEIHAMQDSGNSDFIHKFFCFSTHRSCVHVHTLGGGSGDSESKGSFCTPRSLKLAVNKSEDYVQKI